MIENYTHAEISAVFDKARNKQPMTREELQAWFFMMAGDVFEILKPQLESKSCTVQADRIAQCILDNCIL